MGIAPKEKELAAVGISIAAGCKPCTDFHVKKAREVGATDTEIRSAVTDALSVRRRAADIMETYGNARVAGTEPMEEPEAAGSTDRVKELVCIGAAFGVNCVTSMRTHLDLALARGISPADIVTIVKLSAFIKGKAASHVEHLAETFEKPEVAYGQQVSACC